MASTYTANSGIEKPGSGEQSGTWGTTTNTNFDIIDRVLNGVGSITLSGTTHTLSTSDGSLSDGHYKVLILAGSPSGTNTVTISPNDQDKLYLVNNTTSQSVIFTQGSGGNVTITAGAASWIYADGAGAGAQVYQLPSDVVGDTSPQLGGNLDVNGNSITSASNGNVVIAPNGTGDVQLDTDTVRVGDANADVTVTTNGTGDLTLNTNAGTNSGSVVIADGANNNVTLTANGTGKVELASDIQINGTTNNWTLEVDADDHLIFKYNGTAVFAIQDTGAVIAKDDVTAFGTPT
jgi:hypothetical protein|tara:strand:+ start:825 stop:1700 length:876 start_codon:yes stop_codon:yes gene_type:complete